MSFSRQPMAKSVPRTNGAPQRSLFSVPENSQQQEYAFARQATNYRYSAAQVNPLHSNRPQQRQQQRQPQKSLATSSFGGNQIPGESQIRQPNSRMINPRTGRNQYQQQQQQQQSSSRMMSMSDMNDFIRRQPGGKSFMEENDRAYGGRLNFDQSLSRSGAGMAQRGVLPPELQQMSIPFQPSKSAENARLQREKQLQQMAGQKANTRKPKTWYDTPQAQAIGQIVAREHQETQQRSVRQKQDAEMSQAMNMGIRFQPSQKAQRPLQQQQQQSQQQQQQSQQQAQQKLAKLPPQVRAPPTRVQRRPQAEDESTVSAEPSRYENNTFDDRFNSMQIQGQRGSNLTAQNYDARTERPSILFSQNVTDIQKSVNNAIFLNENQATAEMSSVSVSKNRRKAMEKEEHAVEFDETESQMSLLDREKLRIQKQQELEEQKRIAILKATGREDVLQREAERTASVQEYDMAPKQGQVEYIEQTSDTEKQMSPLDREKLRLQQLAQEQEERRWKVLTDTGRADQVRKIEQQHNEETTVASDRRVRFADKNPQEFYTDWSELRKEDHMMPEREFQ